MKIPHVRTYDTLKCMKMYLYIWEVFFLLPREGKYSFNFARPLQREGKYNFYLPSSKDGRVKMFLILSFSPTPTYSCIYCIIKLYISFVGRVKIKFYKPSLWSGQVQIKVYTPPPPTLLWSGRAKIKFYSPSLCRICGRIKKCFIPPPHPPKWWSCKKIFLFSLSHLHHRILVYIA